MCCLTSIFLVFGSRLAILIWWLLDQVRFNQAFQTSSLPFNLGIPTWLWTLAGGLFLPWTTLVYLLIFQGGITGEKWLFLGIGFLVDMASHGSGYHHRHRIPILRF
ncbi:MAG TPA: hypothetical protein VKF38_10750 [Anaerolineaceae bacterium]|nr:hypothetical protein [Anaerolineaceae bacterium]